MLRLLTDSAADLSPSLQAQPGVGVVPITVRFADGVTLRDGVDATREEFYTRLLAAEKLPTTSQPSPEAFMTAFAEAKAAGDETIVVTLASSLSGTFQCARLAAEECGYRDVWFVDSRTGSAGEALLVREALRLRAAGRSTPEIVAALEVLKPRVCVLAVVDSLKHLHKGGRLPGAVALMGGALGIKPVLSVLDGQIKLADKARGRPGAYVALFRQIEKLGGIDAAYGYTLLYSNDKSVLAPIHHYLHANLHLTGGQVAQLGAAIGTHVGPGVAGLCFVRRD